MCIYINIYTYIMFLIHIWGIPPVMHSVFMFILLHFLGIVLALGFRC